MNETFRAAVHQHTDFSVIDLQGEINAFVVQDLDAIYTEAGSSNPSAIVLNFTDVSYINSTGIALIVGLLAQARKDHRRILGFGLSEHYREIFQITRLSDFMEIYPGEADALEALNAPGIQK